MSGETTNGENEQPNRPTLIEAGMAVNQLVNGLLRHGLPMGEMLQVLECAKLDIYYAMRKKMDEASKPRIFRAGPQLPPDLGGKP